MLTEIQQVGVHDAPLVAALVAGLLLEFDPDGPCDRARLEAVARATLSLNSVTGFAALYGDEAVGLIMLNDCAAIYAGGHFGEITELYVTPALRSRGVAAALVARAQAHGRLRGWKRIEVGAPEQPQWARTLAFYRRAGFTEIGPRLKKTL
ncbi:MAG: GNAT family N-acetyltransferase [Rhodobacteraceae bacterium]|nr:GNAT family N-acetyltransferase [Paracoccaceae bacterium]